MRFSPIAVALATALLSPNGVAQEKAELIKEVQSKLNQQGHDVGAVDGIRGPKTRKGLKEFQTLNGLNATGQIDQQTLSALGVSGSAASGASASPGADATPDMMY